MKKQSPIKVLQLPSWYLPEGGHFCLHQSNALKKEGIDVRILGNVILPLRKYKLNVLSFPLRTFSGIEDGIEVYKYYSWRVPFSEKINREKWIQKTFRLFENYVNKFGRPDLLHVHSVKYGGVVAAMIKEKYNIPYIITEHWSAFSLKSELARKLVEDKKEWIKQGYKDASYIIAVSDEIIPGINTFKFPETPIESISNIINVNFFTIPEKRPANEVFSFVCTNNFRPEKGYDTLLQAVDILHKKNINFNVFIAGDYFKTKEYKDLLSNCSGKEKIINLPLLNPTEIRELLWKSDALLLPSRSESQSLSLLESLSTGLPVICTEVVPARFVTKETGYHIPIEDPVSMSEAMEKMIRTRHTFNEKVIRQHLISLASPEIVAKKIIDVYKKVL